MSLVILDTLPQGVDLSPHLTGEDTLYYIEVSLYGNKYYLAATKNVRRAFGLDSSGSAPRGRKTEDAIRDILNAVQLQLRDNVLAGIKESVTQELLQKMEKIMSPTVEKRILDHLLQLKDVTKEKV